MGKFPLYECDANKNVSCAKTYCKFCNTGECDLTSNKSFARTDEEGQPKIRYHSREELEREMKRKYHLT